jgi:hypothetical protein
MSPEAPQDLQVGHPQPAGNDAVLTPQLWSGVAGTDTQTDRPSDEDARRPRPQFPY